MTTYAELAARVLRCLNDADGVVYQEEIVYDALNAAHVAILPWMPKFGEISLTAGSNGALFLLPADLYSLQSVKDTSGVFVPRATMAPGTARGNPQAENDWIVSPSGYLSLSTPIDTDSAITVYYLAYWNFASGPNDSSFVIEVPAVAHAGMVYYAASHAILPSSTDMATLGGFKTRMDSGNPEQNSMLQQSTSFRRLFLEEMKLLPPYMKASA